MQDSGSRPSSTRTVVGLAPSVGDLLVACDLRSARRYTVAQVPGAPHLIMVAKDDAIRLATDIARTNRVDVWYAENGGHRLIEAFRPAGHP
jgi:hypothetical protein